MIEPKDLLISNSTVITGLLILLTIQSFSGEIRPLEDWNELQKEIRILETEQYALNQTMGKIMEKVASTNSTSRLEEFQKYIDDTSIRYHEVSFKIEQMQKQDFRVRINDLDLTIEQAINYPTFASLIKHYSIVMIFPFAVSSALIVSATLFKEEEVIRKNKRIIAARILTSIGFVTLIAGLILLNYLSYFTR